MIQFRLLTLFPFVAMALGLQHPGQTPLRKPVPLNAGEQAFVEYGNFFSGEKVPLNVHFSRLPTEERASVVWEIKLVDSESGKPIERMLVNTELVMTCGTGYVPHFHYKEAPSGLNSHHWTGRYRKIQRLTSPA